jgi:small nuclear ribonucleoprotein (snRNP)-like protein
VDSQVRVKCLGGRELRGVLRGYDELVNLVLDDCEEFIRGELSWSFIVLYCTCTKIFTCIFISAVNELNIYDEFRQR